jgi:hypothetical protein
MAARYAPITIRTYKDKKGWIIERDYKMRKKGDWA